MHQAPLTQVFLYCWDVALLRAHVDSWPVTLLLLSEHGCRLKVSPVVLKMVLCGHIKIVFFGIAVAETRELKTQNPTTWKTKDLAGKSFLTLVPSPYYPNVVLHPPQFKQNISYASVPCALRATFHTRLLGIALLPLPASTAENTECFLNFKGEMKKTCIIL